jgi:uncharacterized lipoprotein YajG
MPSLIQCLAAAALLLAACTAPQPSLAAFPPDRQCVPSSYNTTAGRCV